MDWFKSQWDRYDCQHEPLLAAGSDHVPANFSGCAFSFWQDKVWTCNCMRRSALIGSQQNKFQDDSKTT